MTHPFIEGETYEDMSNSNNSYYIHVFAIEEVTPQGVWLAVSFVDKSTKGLLSDGELFVPSADYKNFSKLEF
jgi:hypothetical protein